MNCHIHFTNRSPMFPSMFLSSYCGKCWRLPLIRDHFKQNTTLSYIRYQVKVLAVRVSSSNIAHRTLDPQCPFWRQIRTKRRADCRLLASDAWLGSHLAPISPDDLSSTHRTDNRGRHCRRRSVTPSIVVVDERSHHFRCRSKFISGTREERGGGL